MYITIERLNRSPALAARILALACALTCAPLMGGARASAAAGAAPRPVAAVIAEYVQAGLAANLSLANQKLDLEKSTAALDAARARFYPEVALAARYTRADGGRQFDIPVGQLLNPVYQTLNDLLIASGGGTRFAPIGDESIPLQLPREQDTRITLRQPLYAPAVLASFHAAQAAAAAADAAHQAFARQLRRDITLAYLDWLRARNAAQIVAASATLLAENRRVSAALYAQGKGTHDTVLRAEAEWLAIEQQQHEAENGAVQARSYVNFLLNRPLDGALEAAELGDADTPPATPALELATQDALAARPELRQLDHARDAAAAQLRVAQAARRPTLALGVDAGTQGSDYGIGRNYNFVTASLVVNWTLFDAGARSAAVSQARLATAQLANEQRQSVARVALEVRRAHDELVTAIESLATARARTAAARAAFAIAAERRAAGLSSPLEFLDARSTLTSAELNENLTRCAGLQRQAEFDFARGAIS